MDEKYKTLACETLYKNPWIEVQSRQVQYPNGAVCEHGVVLHSAPSVVVYVTKGDDVLGVKAPRYVTGTSETELPGGGMEKGESPVEAAAREVLEETGVEICGAREAMAYYPSNGVSDQKIYVVFARWAGGVLMPQANEVDTVFWMPRAELLRAVMKGEISDGPTVTAVLLQGLE